MAPSGPVLLLLLLLLLSSFLACSRSGPPHSHLQENRALQKRDSEKAAVLDLLKILNGVKPFIGLLPMAGSYLTAIIHTGTAIAGKTPERVLLDYLKFKVDDLTDRIDKNHQEVLFDIWKSTDYAQLEKKITIGWNTLRNLLKDCKEPCFDNLRKNGQDKIIENSLKNARKYVDDLHYVITGGGAYSPNYEKLLMSDVRCHLRRLKIFSAVNALLIHKAITMTNFYNLFNNIKTDEDALADKARDISAAMFEMTKKCIAEPDPYVKKDILDMIEETANRKTLAKNIREYLYKTFYHYDWMVVAFKTQSSSYKSVFTKWLNRHILYGFTAVGKGMTSVAFAKQAKGNHQKKIAQVVEALKKCFEKSVPCNEVVKTLEKCNMKDSYSAIHVYFHKKHGSAQALDTDEAPGEEEFEPDEKQTIPYLYTGKCTMLHKLITKHFRVLIKSDEELMKTDPCKGIECGSKERGECKKVENSHIGLCECEKKYYGEKCEESLEDYKKNVFIKEILQSSGSKG